MDRQARAAMAKQNEFWSGHQIADRCGDSESACSALPTIMEEMGAHLDEDESIELAAHWIGFLPARKKPRPLNGSKMSGDCHADPSPSEAQRERMRRAMRRVVC